MLSVSAFVVPMLIRASNASHLQTYGPLKAEAGRVGSGARVLEVCEKTRPSWPASPATRHQTATRSTPQGYLLRFQLRAALTAHPARPWISVLTASPNVIPVNTSTPVTFTLQVFNNTEAAEQIDRVEILPQGRRINFVRNGEFNWIRSI